MEFELNYYYFHLPVDQVALIAYSSWIVLSYMSSTLNIFESKFKSFGFRLRNFFKSIQSLREVALVSKAR